MKKLFVLIFIITISVHSNAQIRKGAILVGGSFSFTGSKTTEDTSFGLNGSVGEDVKQRFFGIRSSLGFFATESTLIGIALGYESSNFEQTPFLNRRPNMPFKYEDNLFLINPYIAKFSKISDKLYFTTTFNILIGTGKGKLVLSDGLVTIEQLDTDLSQLRLNITPGLTYFMSNKLALTCNIGQLFYNRNKEELPNSTELTESLEYVEKDYGLSVSFNTFLIGFQYFLNNKTNE